MGGTRWSVTADSAEEVFYMNRPLSWPKKEDAQGCPIRSPENELLIVIIRSARALHATVSEADRHF